MIRYVSSLSSTNGYFGDHGTVQARDSIFGLLKRILFL